MSPVPERGDPGALLGSPGVRAGQGRARGVLGVIALIPHHSWEKHLELAERAGLVECCTAKHLWLLFLVCFSKKPPKNSIKVCGAAQFGSSAEQGQYFTISSAVLQRGATTVVQTGESNPSRLQTPRGRRTLGAAGAPKQAGPLQAAKPTRRHKLPSGVTRLRNSFLFQMQTHFDITT